jgi:hypothetical protein
MMEAFYQSRALVFGGGHVVRPLLREAVVAPGWVRARLESTDRSIRGTSGPERRKLSGEA